MLLYYNPGNIYREQYLGPETGAASVALQCSCERRKMHRAIMMMYLSGLLFDIFQTLLIRISQRLISNGNYSPLTRQCARIQDRSGQRI